VPEHGVQVVDVDAAAPRIELEHAVEAGRDLLAFGDQVLAGACRQLLQHPAQDGRSAGAGLTEPRAAFTLNALPYNDVRKQGEIQS